MMRDLYISTLFAVLLSTVAPLSAQNAGVPSLGGDATLYVFQDPEPWSGAKYSTPRSFGDRLYLVGGASISQTWMYDRELDSSNSGINSRIGLGVDLAPVHSLEFGATFNGLNNDRYNSVDASYLFNLSGYGERTEDILPFEIRLRGGVEYSFGGYEAAHILGGLRLMYNFSPTIGIFLEPGVSTCVYAGNGSYCEVGDVSSSVMLGLSMRIGGLINSSQQTMAKNRADWDSDRKTLLAIKSNMLYDIALIPNIEVEIAIRDRWSVGAQVMCGWWLKDDYSRCWQIQAADIEGRYWFGDRSKRRALTGWFAGVFASSGFYDFQLDDDSGMQGEFYVMTGVSGGYSMPIGRRLNLEFAAGVGYVVNDYQKYVVYESQYLVADGSQMRFQSVFPAKVEVSLGWLMFRGSKRGGDR